MASNKPKKPGITSHLTQFTRCLDDQVREEFDGSYASLAAKSGITEPQLSRLRSGRRAPTAKAVGRLARAFSTAAGDQLIARFLELVRAETMLNRDSPEVVEKSDLYDQFR